MPSPKKSSKPQWTMPAWMEPYRRHIVNTGGNPVEELMNDDSSPLINLPRSTLSVAVKSQVAMLERLREYNMLP